MAAPTPYRGGVAAELSALDEYAPPRGFVVLAVTSVAVLLAGLMAVAAMSTSTLNSPADAVRGMLRAASAGDVTAVLEHLDPAERRAIEPGFVATVNDLKRLGVLDPGTDLAAVPGVGAALSGVSLHTTRLDAGRPQLAAVSVTGRAALRVDVAALPLGTLVKPFAARIPVPLTLPVGAGPLVTVERDGQWYVSLSYTLAEAARRRAGAPFPAPGAAVPAVGAATPDALVRALLAAAGAGDTRRLIELIAPDEGEALHVYGPAAIAHLTARLDFSSLALADAPVAGGTLVSVREFTASRAGSQVTLTPSGCFRLTTGGSTRRDCPAAGTDILAQLGFVAVQRGGAWYLSPYRTLADDVERVVRDVNVAAVARLARGGLPAILDALFGVPELAAPGR